MRTVTNPAKMLHTTKPHASQIQAKTKDENQAYARGNTVEVAMT